MFASVMVAVVRVYQVAISSWTPPTCRFTPTCSAYAIEAIEKFGAVKGGWLALGRIGRCHPWGGYGSDPVPGPVDADLRKLSEGPEGSARNDRLVAG